MREILMRMADELAEIRTKQLARVKTMRDNLREQEADLAEIENRQRALAEAILKAGSFLPMRDQDAMKYNSVDVKND